MRKLGLFYVSLFACTMIFMGCGWKIPHENGQEASPTASYGLQSHFSMPGPGFRFDVLVDGCLIGISGNELFMETGLETRIFKSRGPLPGLKTGPYGPSFLRVSPDGSRFAVGDGKGRIGIFNMADLSGNWFPMPHLDAEWADNAILVVTHGEFGEPSRVSCVDVVHHKASPVTLIRNIGGAPAGITFDSQGNLFTGNGFKSEGPSGTGTVKYFPRNLWQSAMDSHTPLDFETRGQVIVDILSGSSLGFDHRGNLHVGGSDAFGDGKDVNFAVLITRAALDEAIRNKVPIDPANARAVHRLDPDRQNATSRYSLNFNPVTRELYLSTGTRIYVCQAGGSPVVEDSSLPVPRKKQIPPKVASHPRFPGTIRLMTYNVSGNFIANSRLDDAFARIFSHVSPDIFIFQEFVSTVASQLPGRLEALLGGTWHIFGGMKSGIYQTMIASRYPLALTSQDTLPPSGVRGVTAALVDLPRERFPTDIYLMGFHLQCCDSPDFQAQRQHAADAAMAWIRDAKTVGGQISLPLQTPMLLAGDFNFIGGLGPETTFTTGNIKDETVFGPDVKPDWDNSDLKDLLPRDLNTGKINTWPGSTPDPDIRYDRFYYTDSVLPSARGFVLNTLNLSEKRLTEASLRKTDTVFASDHLPVVMEIRFP
jgi:endonuclease/exonuclease/phosphatase family metal-dependent hydrolase